MLFSSLPVFCTPARPLKASTCLAAAWGPARLLFCNVLENYIPYSHEICSAYGWVRLLVDVLCFCLNYVPLTSSREQHLHFCCRLEIQMRRMGRKVEWEKICARGSYSRLKCSNHALPIHSNRTVSSSAHLVFLTNILFCKMKSIPVSTLSCTLAWTNQNLLLVEVKQDTKLNVIRIFSLPACPKRQLPSPVAAMLVTTSTWREVEMIVLS